jgi:hypothetical protein
MGQLPLILLLGTMATVAYYYHSIKWNGLLIYPIIIGIFLEAVLATVEDGRIPISLFQITFVISFSVYMLIRLNQKNLEINVNHYIIPLLSFLAIISLSLIYSDDRISGVYNIIRFVVLMVFVGFVTNLVKKREIIYRSFFVIVAVSVALSLFSVFENVFNTEVAIQNYLSGGLKVERSAAVGIYQDPNRFAASLFLPFALSLSLMNSRIKLKYRVLGGVIFFLLLGGILSTYSRSGFLAAVLLIALNIALFNRVKPFIWLTIIGIFIVLMTPNLRMTLLSYGARIIELLTGNVDDSSGIRIMLGIGALQMFVDSYLVGVGFDAFGENFTKYFTIQESMGVYEPHNITYTILAELGIHGFVVFGILIWILLKDSYNNLKKSQNEVADKIISVTFFSTICAYLLFYQFYGGGLFDTALMLTIGLMLSHKSILDNEKISYGI